MNTYENAHATNMLAVYCACCSRPLVDAKSVETGVGPECRSKHGFAKPDLAPDFAAANAALTDAAVDGLPDAPESVRELEPEEAARRLANLYVQRVACDQDGPNVLSYTNALRALGYVKLADRIAKRLAAVTIVRDGDELVVKAPYSEESVFEIRKVPGRRWDKEAKANRFPQASARALWAALERLYMGQTVSGPKGLFVVGAGVMADELTDREIEFLLEEIHAWRIGAKASPGCSADGERYALRMRRSIEAFERRLIAIGHEPTRRYVEAHGWADSKKDIPPPISS